MPAPYTGFSPEIKAEVERCRAIGRGRLVSPPEIGLHGRTHVGYRACVVCGESTIPEYEPAVLGRPREYCDACRQAPTQYRAWLRTQPLRVIRRIAASC